MAVLFGFGFLLAINLIAGMPVGTSAPSSTAAAQQPPQGPEQQLFDLLNQARQQQGLPPLQWNDALAQAARQHAQGMADRGQLTHDLPGEPPLRQRLSAVPLDRSGENVAEDSSINGAHQGFMNSPPHRANILSKEYNQAGIGIVQRGQTYWVTEDFAHAITQVGDRSAEDEVAQAFATARRQAGAPPLQRISSSELHQFACSMAASGQLDTAGALRIPGVRYAVTYTSTDPKKLPAAMLRLRDANGVRNYSVGVCFRRTPKYASGVYWVAAVLGS